MKAVRRIRIRAVAWCAAVVLALFALACFTLAGYLYLSWSMPAHRAALITGVVLVVLVAVVLSAAYWLTRRRNRRTRERLDPSGADDLERLLEARLDPLVRNWINRHPEGAAAGTLLLGIAAGYSRTVRRVLQDIYDNYAETERERRENRDP